MTTGNSSIAGKVFRGIGWTYLSTFLKALSQIVFIAILSRLLEPRDFGLLGIALVFTNLAERVGQLGITPTLIQRHSVSEHEWRVCRSLGLSIGLLVSGALYFLSYPVARYFSEPDLVSILQVLSIVFIFEGACIVFEAWLTRALEFKAIAVIDNLSYFCGYCVVAVPLAALGCGVWSLIAGQLAIRLCKYSLYRRTLGLLSRELPRGIEWSFQTAASILKTGIGFSLGRLLNFAALQGDNFVVGRVLGTESLGLYTRIYQLMTIPSVYVAQVLDKVLFPALALKQKESSTMKSGMLMLLEVVTLISLPLSVVCFILPEVIVSVVLGEKWMDGAPVLRIFAAGIFFRAGYKAGDTVLRSLGRVYRYSLLQAFYALFVIGGTLIGAQYGLVQVAYAVLLAVALNYFALSFVGGRAVGASFAEFVKAHLPGIWVASVVGAGCFVLEVWRRQYGISPFVVFGCAAPMCLFSGLAAIFFAPQPLFPAAIQVLAKREQIASRIRRLPSLLQRALRIELPG
ncbi:MAG: lipopolysaccharide biosynthesis protein [Bdellovibrionales bacterium]|nr:lipopolysaccharide biosynthesis protein [Bdellovibrionales bacterium]